MMHHVMCWNSDCVYNNSAGDTFGYCTRESLNINRTSRCDDYCIIVDGLEFYPNDHEED